MEEKLFTLGPLNERQARTISNACEFYSRVLTGQFDEILSLARYGLITDRDGAVADIEAVRKSDLLMEEVKELLMGLAPGESKGIGGLHTPVQAQHAFELHKVIRHKLAEARGSSHSVDRQDPFLVRYDNSVPRPSLEELDPNPLRSEALQEIQGVLQALVNDLYWHLVNIKDEDKDLHTAFKRAKDLLRKLAAS